MHAALSHSIMVEERASEGDLAQDSEGSATFQMTVKGNLDSLLQIVDSFAVLPSQRDFLECMQHG